MQAFGEVSEWPNVQAWKVCVPQGTAGSNPALSAQKIKGSNLLPFLLTTIKLWRNQTCFFISHLRSLIFNYYYSTNSSFLRNYLYFSNRKIYQPFFGCLRHYIRETSVSQTKRGADVHCVRAFVLS